MTSSLPQITILVGGIGHDTTYAYYDDGSQYTQTPTAKKYTPDNLSTDISIYFRDQFSVTRGASQVPITGLIAEAGSFTTILSNFDRRFDPTNLSGPYVVASRTQIVPGAWILVTATWNAVDYPVFRGTMTGWPQSYPAQGRDQDVKLNAADGVRAFARAQLVKTVPAQTSGERIDEVLDAIGYSQTERSISPGITRVPFIQRGSISAWSVMTDAANAEWGDLFVDASGQIIFNDRQAIASDPDSLTSQATFGDANDGIELPFHDVTLGYDDSVIINDATIRFNSTGLEKSAGDIPSQGQPWGVMSWNQSYQMSSGSDATQFVNWLIHRYAYPALRVETLVVKPQKKPTALWPVVLSLDIGDRITVKLTPQGGGSHVIRDVFIRGIAHNYSNRAWQTTYTLQDADWTSELARYDFTQYDDGTIYAL